VFEKIVLAVDGSEPSARALEAAAYLARGSGGEVVAVHVVERIAGGRGSPFEVEGPEAADLLDEAVRTLKERGVNARGELRHTFAGRVAKEILDLVAAEHADLVVMGTRGLSNWEGMLVGSTAHKVLHLGRSPVLAVR